MRLYGSLWALWVLISSYESLCVVMGLDKSLCVRMGPYGSLRDPFRSLCVFMDSNASV